MAETNWIDETYIKNNSVISDIADVKILIPSITWCQDYYIKEILGTNLWNEINDQINIDAVSTANRTLLDEYILKALLQYMLYSATPDFLIRLMNKGMLSATAEGYSQPSSDQINEYRMEILNKAQWYRQQATNFLTVNYATYPKYIVQTELNAVYPTSNGFSSSLYLEDDGKNIVSISPFRQPK